MSVGHLPSTTGSSPHTRGALHGDRVDVHPIRIIPAYAGSTLFAIFIQLVDKDHPRIRGEHSTKRVGAHDCSGSSPHTRGAPQPVSELRRGRGIIPAYAGSTPPQAPRSRRGQDHPRIRGEHKIRATEMVLTFGSSPHTRGALAHRPPSPPPFGIIPAYAGSTSIWRSANVDRLGSSPHTRGALYRAWPPRRPGGIIPAYAGSTDAHVGSDATYPDHPRIRGEHTCSGRGLSSRLGSSPHTRGAPVFLGVPAAPVGIIPAYAGSTARRMYNRGEL